MRSMENKPNRDKKVFHLKKNWKHFPNVTYSNSTSYQEITPHYKHQPFHLIFHVNFEFEVIISV